MATKKEITEKVRAMEAAFRKSGDVVEVIQSDIGAVEIKVARVSRSGGRLGSYGNTSATSFKVDGVRISRASLFEKLT